MNSKLLRSHLAVTATRRSRGWRAIATRPWPSRRHRIIVCPVASNELPGYEHDDLPSLY